MHHHEKRRQHAAKNAVSEVKRAAPNSDERENKKKGEYHEVKAWDRTINTPTGKEEGCGPKIKAVGETQLSDSEDASNWQ
jgi:hypothetical protein